MLQWLKRRLEKAAELKIQPDLTRGEKWNRLEQILGFPVVNRELYERALRHRSIIDGELYEKHETYERLEFLGDAVLDLVITEIIFEKFPTRDEGFMTKLRAKLVRGDTLAKLARDLELNSMLEIGERAQGQGIELSRGVLADVFESLVAAIYQDAGYAQVYSFIETVIEEHLDVQEISLTTDNYKSVLLEFTQANRMSLPFYRVVSESGPGHDKTFTVAVSVDGVDYGTGEGKSKKQAEQLAAKLAVERLKSDHED